MNERQIIRKVEHAIRSHGMFQPHEAVLAGVSGGPDSMALLHILLRLAPEWRLSIGVAHLDHGLRGAQSRQDAAFVEAHCRRLKLPFFKEARDVAALCKTTGTGLEAAARRVRYRFFDRTAQKGDYDKIALGHHAGDNAELILMNLLRGSGPLGLAGIPPVRDHLYVRPLIYLKREEILFFLQKNRIDFLRDPTNADRRFLRNRIRHELLPHLAERYNPKIAAALDRYARIAGDEEDWCDRRAEGAFTDLADIAPGSIEIPTRGLLALHPALQRRVIRKAIRELKGDLKKITFDHVEMLLQRVCRGAGGGHADLPGHLAAERLQSSVVIHRCSSARPFRGKDFPPSSIDFRYHIGNPQSVPGQLLIQETGMRIKWRTGPKNNADLPRVMTKTTACFDLDKITWPLTVRSFRPGDRFRPLGMAGSQKLKKYFIDNKIPRALRHQIPILVNKDEIIWIAGHRAGSAAPVTDGTQNILKVELLLA